MTKEAQAEICRKKAGSPNTGNFRHYLLSHRVGEVSSGSSRESVLRIGKVANGILEVWEWGEYRILEFPL